jgi:hypothetical protein
MIDSEGHTRILCENGHLREIAWHGADSEDDPCPECGGDTGWFEKIDTTIGWSEDLETELIPSGDSINETFEIPHE